MTMMNRNIRTPLLTFSTILVISSAILTTQLFVGVGSYTQKALGQAEEEFAYGETFATATNATSGANQTGASMQNQTTTTTNQTATPTPTAATTTNQTAGNQTTAGAGAQLANLTQANFETLRENLASAREGLQGLENEAAFTALTSANNDLFSIIDSQGEDRIKALAGQLKPIQTSIDKAQDAIRNNDFPMALNALTSADSEILKLTQQLPADEDDDEADEDDADTDEDDGG
jgi:hypothetical protein